MAEALQLKIVTPDRTLLDAPVEAVYVETLDGQIGILSGHVPLLTALKIGVLRFTQKGKEEHVALMGGMLETNGQQISVLANSAGLAYEIDELRALAAKERAEAKLHEVQDHVEVDKTQMSLARAMVRLNLLKDLGVHRKLH